VFTINLIQAKNREQKLNLTDQHSSFNHNYLCFKSPKSNSLTETKGMKKIVVENLKYWPEEAAGAIGRDAVVKGREEAEAGSGGKVTR